jgi:hypothetical protein
VGAITINIEAAGRFDNEEFYMVADCSGDNCEDMSAAWGVGFPCTSTRIIEASCPTACTIVTSLCSERRRFR